MRGTGFCIEPAESMSTDPPIGTVGEVAEEARRLIEKKPLLNRAFVAELSDSLLRS
jgi:hypothetical protein